MQLKVHTLTVDTRWSVNTQLRAFAANASDLGYRAGESPSQQLYDDAADRGVALFNPSSGNTTHWYETLSSSGEYSWEYRPTVETVRQFPSLKGWTVKIYND